MKFNKFYEINEGLLIPIEFKDLPFIPKRIFFVTNVPVNVKRGNHAHYETQQILICLKGKILVKLYDGKNYENILIKQGEYVFIDKLIWDSQKFLTNHDVLLVLCSTEYNPDDYILNINEYEKILNNIPI